MSLSKDTGKCGVNEIVMCVERNCLSFETAVGAYELPSPRLTVPLCHGRESVAGDALPTFECSENKSYSVYYTDSADHHVWIS